MMLSRTALNGTTLNELPIASNDWARVAESVAAMTIRAIADGTYVSDAVLGDGAAVIALAGSGDPTINSSSDGVATIRLLPFGDMVIPESILFDGVASVQILPQLDPYVWTYLYNEGIASISLRGVVRRLAIRPIPAEYAEPGPGMSLVVDEGERELDVGKSRRDFDVERERRELVVQDERMRA